MKGIDLGETYINRNSCVTFISFIAKTVKEKLKSTLATCKFLSVLSDGATDCSVIEQEIVYVRFAQRGSVTTQFVSIQAVEKADSQHITQAICTAMDGVDEQWQTKLVATGTDGASVMLGSNTGVATRLKADKKYIISMHCMNHRLELAFKDAASSTNCHKKLAALLLGLYLLYHKSALNRANLKRSFLALGMQVLIPTRACGTRWVTHQLRAVDHFLRGYKGILQHLEQVRVSKVN